MKIIKRKLLHSQKEPNAISTHFVLSHKFIHTSSLSSSVPGVPFNRGISRHSRRGGLLGFVHLGGGRQVPPAPIPCLRLSLTILSISNRFLPSIPNRSHHQSTHSSSLVRICTSCIVLPIPNARKLVSDIKAFFLDTKREAAGGACILYFAALPSPI